MPIYVPIISSNFIVILYHMNAHDCTAKEPSGGQTDGSCQGPGLTMKAEERFLSRTWTHDESGGEVPVRKTCVKVSCFGKVWGRKLSVRERSKYAS